MIPLRDDNPTRTTPYVVYTLIALNVVMFLYTGALKVQLHGLPTGYELIPARLMTRHPMGLPTPVAPWMTIFTSMFMHANLLHIGGNMLYLWIFGNNVEDTLGHFRFILFYLLAGLGAAMAQVGVSPMSMIPMVGASGAIAGVLGAYLVLFPRARIDCLVPIFYIYQLVDLPSSVVLGFWILIQVANSHMQHAGASGGVAYAAHIGGFVAGIILLLCFGGRRLLAQRTSRCRYQDEY